MGYLVILKVTGGLQCPIEVHGRYAEAAHGSRGQHCAADDRFFVHDDRLTSWNSCVARAVITTNHQKKSPMGAIRMPCPGIRSTGLPPGRCCDHGIYQAVAHAEPSQNQPPRAQLQSSTTLPPTPERVSSNATCQSAAAYRPVTTDDTAARSSGDVASIDPMRYQVSNISRP